MMPARLDEKGLLLGDLLYGIVATGTGSGMLVQGVTLDSREVEPGHLFLALQGYREHALEYLDDVVARGAVAVLAEPADSWHAQRISDVAAASAVPVLVVPGLREQVGRIAGRFFGQPAHAMRMIGVTGTNAKTSITHFLAQAMAPLCSTGMIGTLGNGFPGNLRAATHTTPDAVHLQVELARLLAQGAQAVAMEVSSHALHQGRVSGVPFHTAVFTNLSRDHQDYHGNMEAYAEAKARLFHRVGLALAVINSDDDMGMRLLAEIQPRVNTVAVGRNTGNIRTADRFVEAVAVETRIDGLTVNFDSSWGGGRINSPLLGRFNAENLLLSLAVLLSWGMPLQNAVSRLARLRPVAGRMSTFGGDQQKTRPLVVVDYAHTPDALEKALTSLREHTSGELLCVFGCGGDRDIGKRPLMGGIAARLADRVIVTDDNPRTEEPRAIVADILKGMDDAPENTLVEHDRGLAIQRAIEAARPGDLVLVAGKGHETYQQIGDLKLPFSDLEKVQQLLSGSAK